MGNIHVELDEIRTNESGGDVIQRKSERTDDGQRPIIIAHFEPSAEVS